MNKKCKFICIAGSFVLLIVSLSCAQIQDVSSLDNLSQSQARDTLNKSGFKPLFKYCFSDDVKKHYIIPGSQDPEAGTPLEAGGQVKVSTSLGPLPVVIGKNKDEAKFIFDELDIPVDFIQGRNSSLLKDYIYDQIPLKAECMYPNFKIKLFYNAPLNGFIISPKEGEVVMNTVLIRANISPYLLPGEHLWIAVKPYRSIADWWPQSNGPVELANGHLEGYAYLNGELGDQFEIAIILLDDYYNSKFTNYLHNSTELGSWPAITRGDPVTGERISKEAIENRKLASVIVTINVPKLQKLGEVADQSYGYYTDHIRNKRNYLIGSINS